MHTLKHAASSVAHSPITKDLAHQAGTALINKYIALEELNLWGSIKHGVSTVAHNPTAQALAKKGATALINHYT